MAWTAEILIEKHDDPQTLTSVMAKVIANSADEAKDAAQFIYNALAAGKLRFLRCPPEGESFTDFDTGITRHKGYTRFAFRDEPGDEIIPDQSQIRSIGLGNLNPLEVIE